MIHLNSIGQDLHSIDSTLRKIGKKGNLKRIKIGRGPNAEVIWFRKSNKEIFCIFVRKRYGSKKIADSAVVFQNYFINDTLIKIWYSCLVLKKSNGGIELYFAHGKLVSQRKKGVLFFDVDLLVKEAYTLLAEAKMLLKKN